MDIRNCRNCGRVFNYIGGVSLCESCKEAVEKKFRQVREYIENNKHASIPQIAEDNEVTVQQINQWIREERLMFAEDSPIGIGCEKCGKMIRTGRFCEACKNEMAHSIKKAYSKPPVSVKEKEEIKKPETRDKAKMRYLETKNSDSK